MTTRSGLQRLDLRHGELVIPIDLDLFAEFREVLVEVVGKAVVVV